MRSPHAARCPFEITAQRLCSDQQSVAICYFSFLDQAGLILSRFGADTDRLLATRSLSRPRLIGSHDMEWADYLRDEAAKYRQLAEQTDDPVIKNEMLELASVCEEVADNIEDRLTGG
jgi:hypothetical protein